MSIFRTERHSLIIEYIVSKGSANINELPKIYRASPEVISRDLTTSADKDILTRSFGGAIISENAPVSRITALQKLVVNA